MSGNTKNGYTIVEMVIAIVVGSIISLVVLAFTFSLYTDTLKTQAETSMLIDSQIILRRVADDMRFSSGILTTNTIPDPNEPASGWNTSNADLILILSSPAVDTQGNHIIDDDTSNPYQNELIYFADGENLYKRVLANPEAADNQNITTCPETIATTACPSDPILSETFLDLSFVFYDQNNSVTADPTLGRSVDILIQLAKNVFGEDIDIDNQVRMTLRNPFLN